MINQIEPSFGAEEIKALSAYIKGGGWGTEHTKTRELESKIASFLGVKHVSMTTSGTQALMFALRAVGVNAGDEVLVPSLTMIATCNAVRALRAKPIFCDVNDSLCMDWSFAASEKLSDKTKAVIYVSLNGRSGGLSDLIRDCYERGIPVVEDACQSFGSKHQGHYLGTLGDIGCYSLSPHKIISTGQGGFIATNSTRLYDKFRSLKDFGRLEAGIDIHPEFGLNGKFTDFQSVIGLAQMEKLQSRISSKKVIYGIYKDNLSGIVDFVDTPSEVVPWFVDIYLDEAKKLKNYLAHKNIQTRLMYPPCHSQPCYNEDWNLPNTERASKRGIWLPSSPTLKKKEIERICRLIKEF
jgi:perosamine synthetase